VSVRFEAASSLRSSPAIAEAVRLVRARIAEGGPDQELLEDLLPALRRLELPLPQLSDAASRVVSLFTDEAVDLDELARAVQLDPAVATKVVGVANSAYFRGIEPVSGIRDALVRMGLRDARTVVLSVVLRTNVFRVPGLEATVQDLWSHSVLSGLVCQRLLEAVPPWQGQAYLLGLVHDVGRIPVYAFVPEVARRRGGRPADWSRVAVLAAGPLHAVLGGALLEAWRFPADVVRAVRDHHEELSLDEAGVLGSALRLADVLAHRIHHGFRELDEVLDPPRVEALRSLGLDEERGLEVVADSTRVFHEISRLV